MSRYVACAILSGFGCRESTDRPEVSDASSARLPDRPMTLVTTPIAPGETGGFRIVGGLPSTDVTIVRGAVGAQTCPPPLNGACFDVGGAKLVGRAATDADGALLLEIAMPSTIKVGKDLAFQALTMDAGGVAYVSNVVEKTIVDPLVYEAAPATNVLVLLLDDVGVDRFALYGASHPATTPVIDSLAADGVLFTNAWALPWCGPSRAALQTGRYGRRTGYGENSDTLQGSVELDPNLITLAELVEHSPFTTYATSYVGKWHLAAFGSASSTLSPIVQGWDWWAGAMGNLERWEGPNPGGGSVGYYNWQKVDTNGVVSVSNIYATTDSVDEALGRVAVMSEPWMMQVSFNAAHAPYNLPPANLHTNAALTDYSPLPDKHRAIVEAADTEIGRLLAGIAVDVLDRTTIFVLGDNGSPRLVLKGEEPDWREAKGTLMDGGVRVPLIVSGPLVGTPGSTSTALAHVVDVFPTVADIVGVDTATLRGALDPATPVELDGFSLLPILEDPARSTDRTTLYAEEFAPGGAGPFWTDLRTIRNDKHKLIVDANCGSEQFFEYLPGAHDEGDDLLLGGPLTPDQQDALDTMRAELATLVGGLTYDAATWPDSMASNACGGDTGDTGDTGTPADTGDTAVPAP